MNNLDAPIMSAADNCGRNVLNMSGSLVNYINTGNAGSFDSFEKKGHKNNSQLLKNLAVAIVLAVCTLVIGRKSSKAIKDLTDKAGDWITKVTKIDFASELSKAKNTVESSKAATFVSETKEKVVNSNLVQKGKNLLNGISAKFKK